MTPPRDAPRSWVIIAVTTGTLILVSVAIAWARAPITDAYAGQHRERYHSRDDVVAAWREGSAPEWIPSEARAIRLVSTPHRREVTILATTDATSPSGCARADRRAVPVLTADWVPDTALPGRVWSCGAYDVVKVRGGLLGWAADAGRSSSELGAR